MKSRQFASIFLIFLLVLGACEVGKGSVKLTPAQCKQERALGINACKQILYGRQPSAQCCLRIRITDIQCVCPVITPKLAALIDVNRFVKIIEGCGRKVPRHFKCGSITTP